MFSLVDVIFVALPMRHHCRLNQLWEAAQFLPEIIRWGRGKTESKAATVGLSAMKRHVKIAPQTPEDAPSDTGALLRRLSISVTGQGRLRLG